MVQPEQYHEKPPLLVAYYSYWSGLPVDGRYEIYIRPDRGFAAWPTHDDLTLVIGGWPYAELQANRYDLEANFHKMLQLAPSFAERVHSATRQRRLVGAAVPNYFRKPYGPAGRWSGMPATTRTSSPPRACTTPSATPSCSPPPWTRPSPTPAPSRTPWATTSPPATSRSCPVRAHHPVRHPRASTPRAPAAPGRRARQPAGDGRLRPGHGGDHVPRGLSSPRRTSGACSPWPTRSVLDNVTWAAQARRKARGYDGCPPDDRRSIR
jgi:hypothetical protein